MELNQEYNEWNQKLQILSDINQGIHISKYGNLDQYEFGHDPSKVQSEYLQNYDKIPLQFVHKDIDA